ncbi:prephenate dehydratase [Ekhidna sp.]|uniref:prephenate dehydratase n=1 Tax=Ekhidna sp. TaxID=2608089 RepID=UPI003BA84E98
MNRIAIQGLKGSFHHEAALHHFGDQIILNECETFRDVVNQVLESEADFGLMAIENSLAGCIIPNYALLRKGGLTICGEVILQVKMNLMVYNGTNITDVAEIESHQMAIRQCSNFLDNHEKLRVVESFDTAGSARHIKENKLSQVAAIASSLAAKTYDLTILQSGIENKESFTRFLVLTKAPNQADEETDKASIYLETKHEPGALAKVLTAVSDLGVNLSKLQSHPVSGWERTYGFFMDLEFSDSGQESKVFQELASLSEVIENLGVYKKGKIYE